MMRTVIFDLDGTLADTAGDLIAAANVALGVLGHGSQLVHGRDDATALRGGRAMLRLGLERAGALDAAVIDRGYPLLLEAYGAAIATHTTLYPGAIAAVERLRAAGAAVGICTNKPEALAIQLLAALGITHHFASLVGADTLPTRKPDPAPFHAAVARAGGSHARACLIGDTVTDRETARAAGVPSVLVTFSAAGRSVSDLKPEALLDHYDDLDRVLDLILP
jgi:phosphoglycolate phosphatase